MAYIKVGWTETVAITAARLNAMETQYDEFYSDFEVHDHDTRYYTKAQADARFFDADNDGAGSGLDAATVDGYTAEAIEAAAVPRGSIGLWSGSYESIPAGFVACNGFNSTPDLRDRMVVGAGQAYAKGATGGYATRTPTGTLTVATHALTEAQMPEHRHGYDDYYETGSDLQGSCAGYPAVPSGAITEANRTTGTAGSGDPHGHSGSTIAFDAYSNLPPYYGLWWIMRALS